MANLIFHVQDNAKGAPTFVDAPFYSSNFPVFGLNHRDLSINTFPCCTFRSPS